MSVRSLTTLSDYLLGRHVLQASLDAVLVLAPDPCGAEVDDLHLAAAREHDVARLQVAVIDAAPVHVVQRRGHVDEQQDELAPLGRLELVERAPSTNSISNSTPATLNQDFLIR